MKKILNKKGFTLVELLAVIVVLAIIMLVVADRVGDAMKQSRGDSLLLQVKSIEREIDKICIVNNEITLDEIKGILDGSGLEYTEGAVLGNTKFEATAKRGSKFSNIIVPKNFSGIITGESGKTVTITAGETVMQPVVSIKVSCPMLNS